MTSPIDIEALSDIMHQQIQLLGKLDTTLTEEQVLLEKNQFDILEKVTAEKIALLDQLGRIELQHQTFLKKTTFKDSQNQRLSLKSVLAQLGPNCSPGLRSLEEKLATLTGKCNDQNKINGILIHSRRKKNQQILSLLQNTLATSSATTYGKNGATSSLPMSSTAVKA
jgi:flagellar biosynthesis/type III secretory pathway chaperone